MMSSSRAPALSFLPIVPNDIIPGVVMGDRQAQAARHFAWRHT
jgi:hypothetical protein